MEKYYKTQYVKRTRIVLKLIILYVFLHIYLNSFAQEQYHNFVKIDSKINSLFKGEGFVFESIGYEHPINNKMSVGGWIGFDANSSKLNVGKTSSSASNSTNLFVMIDYYCFLFKKEKDCVYISPAISYKNNWIENNKDRTHIYGMNLSLGYRRVFNRIVLDCALYKGFEHTYQKNDTYLYKSNQITSIDMKIAIGYLF